MVLPGGFEPPTFALEGHCSIQLSYGSTLEQVKGIGPSQPAWKASVLPLNYTCKCSPSLSRWHEIVKENLKKNKKEKKLQKKCENDRIVRYGNVSKWSYWAALEMRLSSNRHVGSNPTVSANRKSYETDWKICFVFLFMGLLWDCSKLWKTKDKFFLCKLQISKME